MEDKTLMESILENKGIVLKIISFIDIFSFLLSQVLLVLILNQLIIFDSKKFQVIFYALILFFSIIFFRNNYLFMFKNLFSETKKKTKKFINNFFKFSFEVLKSAFLKLIDVIFLFKILFFNVLKYLFYILIVALIIIGFSYLFGYLDESNFNSNFISIIGLMSIVLGFFQYYLKNYKESVYNNLVNYITNFLKDFQSEFTYEEFEKFLSNKYSDELKYINSKKKQINIEQCGHYKEFKEKIFTI